MNIKIEIMLELIEQIAIANNDKKTLAIDKVIETKRLIKSFTENTSVVIQEAA